MDVGVGDSSRAVLDNVKRSVKLLIGEKLKALRVSDSTDEGPTSLEDLIR